MRIEMELRVQSDMMRNQSTKSCCQKGAHVDIMDTLRYIVAGVIIASVVSGKGELKDLIGLIS